MPRRIEKCIAVCLSKLLGSNSQLLLKFYARTTPVPFDGRKYSRFDKKEADDGRVGSLL